MDDASYEQRRGPLFINSTFLILTSVSAAGVGFIFWMVATNLYSQEEVGVAAAMISSLYLLIVLSRLGFDQSLVRFFPEGDKDSIFSTSIILTTLAAVVFGVALLCTAGAISPELQVLQDHPIEFVLFLSAGSMTTLCGIAFVAQRRASLFFMQSIVLDSRVIILFVMIPFGAMGIFNSLGLVFVIAALFSLAVLVRIGLKPHLKVNAFYMKEALIFSTGNYVTSLLGSATSLIIPVVVLASLGPENAANYFIAYSIASLLFIVPSAFSTSLFVEGSHGESISGESRRAAIGILILLVPAVIFILLFGDTLLSFFGEDYVAAYSLLRILSLSSFFVAFCSVHFSIKKIHKEMRELVCLNAFIFSTVIIISLTLMPSLGITAIGYGWLVSYSSCSLVIAMLNWRLRKRS